MSLQTLVEPERRPDTGRLVPLDLVDGPAGEIRLRCTKAEFERLHPAKETEFIPAASGYEGYDSGQVDYWPYYGLGGGMGVTGLGLGGGIGFAGIGFREHRDRQPARDPCSPARRPLAGPQGSCDPDQRGSQHRHRHPAQDHQAGRAGPAAR
jgi:hypothetical protein